MWRIQISLLGILFFIIFIETSVIPFISQGLRVDFFIGMIIALVIYAPFSRGFIFVIISTLFLQAFTGARLGYISLFYMIAYLGLDLLKNIIYLESFTVQFLIGASFQVFIVFLAAIIVGMDVFPVGIYSLMTGAFFTGIVTPVMVYIVYRLQIAYEPA